MVSSDYHLAEKKKNHSRFCSVLQMVLMESLMQSHISVAETIWRQFWKSIYGIFCFYWIGNQKVPLLPILPSFISFYQQNSYFYLSNSVCFYFIFLSIKSLVMSSKCVDVTVVCSRCIVGTHLTHQFTPVNCPLEKKKVQDLFSLTL